MTMGSRTWTLALLLAASGTWLLAGCCKKIQRGLDDDPPRDFEPETAAASASAVAAEAPEASGPTVSIPAGQLIAGTACQSVPRITNEELEGLSIQMGAFDIDAYPYPNDPSKPPLTNVTRDEAQAMCQKRGRRLCTELEWERACKGPNNTTYEYGNRHQVSLCPSSGTVLRNAGAYEKCASGFGVKAMHGLVWEWTASDWGRGGPGGMATVRGGESSALRGRCANGQSRSPADKQPDLGFRCCGGAANSPSVDLSINQQPVLTTDRSVDSQFAQRLIGLLPAKKQKVAGFDISIDKIWRWHPRANEELIVARYVGRGQLGTFYEPLVFHACGDSIVLASRPRGPSARMAEPATGSNAQKISIKIGTDSDEGELAFTYSYGTVTVQQPEWLKDATSVGPSIRKPPGLHLKLPGRK